MLGYPRPPWGARRLTSRSPSPPPPSSRPPKIFAPGWGLEFKQAAPLVWVRLSWDVQTCLHYAGEVQWIKETQTQHKPYGWEVRVRVMLAGGARDVVMGVSIKEEGHYLWTIGTPRVLSQVKNMVFGPQAGVGGVARIHFCLLLLEPRPA